jgi:hypothetical protein
MRLRVRTNRVRGKSYKRYQLDLSQNEGIRLEKLGLDYEIEDIDPKGWVSLKRILPTTSDLLPPNKTPTSINLNLSKEDWSRFKGIMKGNGLTTCQAFSNYVQAVNEAADKLGEYPSITVINVWEGVPRSRSQRLVRREVQGLA